MKTTTQITILGLSLSFFLSSGLFAQTINTPSDLPNSARIKIIGAKLSGMTAHTKDDFMDDDFVNDQDEFENGDFVYGQTGDCSVGIGNVTEADKVDRDVIILGDVINLCN